MNEFKKDNHYIPRFYLRYWSNDNSNIWVYRKLVSHKKVPPWNECSISGIAKQNHLYTCFKDCEETDFFEKWFEREFETPVQNVYKKITSNRHLTADEWRVLIRYTASQCVRTPSQYIRIREQLLNTLPTSMERTLEGAVKKLKEKGPIERKEYFNQCNEDVFIDVPLDVPLDINIVDDEIHAKVIVGRDIWLYMINYLLTNTVNVLSNYYWRIIHFKSFELLTSDDPVICINYYNDNNYDFKGGWGKRGSEFLFPLTPHHLLYTRVGEKKKRLIEPTESLYYRIQKVICEHAFRYIYAKNPDEEVGNICPRTINAEQYKNEEEAWRNWQENQSSGANKNHED